MKEVHFVVQGKGGVGKSFIAALLAQYLIHHYGDIATDDGNAYIQCFDTDPVNPTFSRMKELEPTVVDILTQHHTIDTREFDELVEVLVELDGMAVIDNGAATFIPLMSYMNEGGIVDLLRDNGVRVIMHVPLNGGQALDDCIAGLVQTLASSDAEVVVWLNDFKGEIQEGGKPFTSFKIYQSNKDRIIGVVHIPNRAPDTFGKDIAVMTENNLTFNQAAQRADLFKLAARSRLNRVKNEIYAQLEQLSLGQTDAN
jgi:traL protein